MAGKAPRPATTKAEGSYAALLRGINLGGHNKLPMKDLAAMFGEAGCSEVRTYIQSGNVAFRAAPSLARRLPAAIGQRVEEAFGFRVPLVLRSAAQLLEVSRGNPFLEAGVDPGELHVSFLADPPDARRVASLDPRQSPPDELVVRGQEIYLRLPSGVARSKLTNDYFDRALATISTMRNWRTVLTLVEMTRG